MSSNSRVLSLKSTLSASSYRRTLLYSSGNSNMIKYKKKRPSTWTCHQHLSLSRRYTISPRLSRWCSQHYKSSSQRRPSSTIKGISSKNSSIIVFHPPEEESDQDQPSFDTKRQTMATISTSVTTLNHHSSANTIYHPSLRQPAAVFHTQSMLFLFGFLFFPCWWVGGYYLKVKLTYRPVTTLTAAIAAQNHLDLEEKQMMTVHPSLLANGKTSSRSFWITLPQQQDTKPLFRKWNQIMSIVSVGLSICIAGLLIWYAVAY